MQLTYGLITLLAGALIGLVTATVTSYINKLNTEASEIRKSRDALTVEIIETLSLFYNYRKFYVACDNGLCLTTAKIGHVWLNLKKNGLSENETDDLQREEKLLDKERDSYARSVDLYFEKLLGCESKIYGQLVKIERYYNLSKYTELSTVLMGVINEGNSTNRFAEYDTVDAQVFSRQAREYDQWHTNAMHVMQERCNDVITDIKNKLN